MSVTGTAFVGMLGVSLAVGIHPVVAEFQRYQANGWTLAVRHDRFTKRTSCALASTNRQLQYQQGAGGFLVGERRGTLTAWYRVDGGAPVRWQDRTPLLIGVGVAFDGPGLDDPTGGWIWIPVAEVEHAKEVAIRAGSTGRVRRYRIAGFAAMLDASHRLGCGSYDTPRV